MPSASSAPIVVVAACALLGLALAGCDTTQDKAARLKVRSTRELAGREPARPIRRRDRDVRVLDASIVRGQGKAAIAVTLRNVGSAPVNDLPLAVGVRMADGEHLDLTSGEKVAYFQAHAPALAPGERTTWVFTSHDDLGGADSAFAEVGVARDAPTTASSVPALAVSSVGAAKKDPGKVEATVANTTGVVQYDVAVYGWALRHGRYVAAGRTDVEELDPDESTTVAISMTGKAKGASLHVAAPPTIFQ